MQTRSKKSVSPIALVAAAYLTLLPMPTWALNLTQKSPQDVKIAAPQELRAAPGTEPGAPVIAPDAAVPDKVAMPAAVASEAVVAVAGDERAEAPAAVAPVTRASLAPLVLAPIKPVLSMPQPLADRFAESERAPRAMVIGNGLRDALPSLSVPVTNWRDWPFQTVKRQALDYSCGSATVATLLTYAYGRQVSEKEVFLAMYTGGNQEKIKREGFSMLDMVSYIAAQGYKVNGYRLTLDEVAEKEVPFIALINRKGYNHFVVVKSVRSSHVLIGDPNTGNVIEKRSAFEKMWNGIALVITSDAKYAKTAFNDKNEWRRVRTLAYRPGSKEAGIDTDALEAGRWQVGPSNTDILRGMTNAMEDARNSINNISTGAGGSGL